MQDEALFEAPGDEPTLIELVETMGEMETTGGWQDALTPVIEEDVAGVLAMASVLAEDRIASAHVAGRTEALGALFDVMLAEGVSYEDARRCLSRAIEILRRRD